MKRTMGAAAAVLVATALVLAGTGTASASSPSVYQPCDSSEVRDRATDPHGIPVICEYFTLGAQQWLPELTPDPVPVIPGDFPACSVPGLVSEATSGAWRICVHGFDAMYYFRASEL